MGAVDAGERGEGGVGERRRVGGLDDAGEFAAKREGGTVEGGVVLVFAACLEGEISWRKWEMGDGKLF